jgi:tetratricopeptide (TPR) repeat protein
MPMKAVLSGRARAALILDGSRASYWLDESRTAWTLSSGETHSRIADASDLELIECEDKDSLLDRLMASDAAAESLDLVLFLLDRDLTDETRCCAAEELESNLAIPSVLKYLQSILFAECLPPSADIEGALKLSEGFNSARSFIQNLNEMQKWIPHVRIAWDRVTFEKEKNSPNRKAIEGLFLRYGVFSETAIALSEGKSVNPIQLKFSVDPSLKKSLPRVSQILNSWMTPLRSLVPKTSNAAFTVQNTEDHDYSSLCEEVNGSGPVHVKADKALDAALAQVQRIADLAKDGKDPQALQMLEELIAEQLKHENGDVHLVKSLCNIASKATQVARDDFAGVCLVRALNIDSTDARAYFQLANYLRDDAKYDLASRAYEKAITFTPNSDWQSLCMIRSAKAHSLTEQGNYDDALAEYEAIPYDSHDIGTRTAIADVNRRKGAFSVAMRTYLNLIYQNPWHHRSFAGKAEIAKRRGNPHKAIRLYNYVLRDDAFTLDTGSRTIYTLAKGHLLKIVGQYDKALNLVKEVIRDQPFNLTANLQMASILALSESANAGISLLATQRPRAIDAWKIHYFRGLMMFRANRISEGKRELLEHMDLTNLLPEDLPLAKSAQAFVYLAERNTSAVQSILQDVRPFDRNLRDLHQIFQTHVKVIENPQNTPIHFPTLKRSLPGLRLAVEGLRHGDLKAAIASEVACLLQAA